MTVQVSRYFPHGPSLWSFDRLPAGIRAQPMKVRAEDGAESFGTLYGSERARVLVHVFHPRSDTRQHYLIPLLVEAGFAVWGHASRSCNSDSMLVDQLLLDIKATMYRLAELGFSDVVALGNSSGGPLMTLYQSEATRPRGARRFGRERSEAPRYSALVYLAAPRGQADLLRQVIDPSVVDEADPLSVDPELDMYSPENGFRVLPEASQYTEVFLSRYRAGQLARIARIDAEASARVNALRFHLDRLGASGLEELSWHERRSIERRCCCDRSLVIHRTEANPAYTDLTLEPNERSIGSFFSPRPDLSNYSSVGFARQVTPESWFSTWSHHRSLAGPLAGIEDVRVPILVLNYDADHVVMRSDAEMLVTRAGASDKTLVEVPGDHLGYGRAGPGDTTGRERAAERMISWVKDRFYG